MKVLCTYDDIMGDGFNDSVFDTCKQNRHELIEVLDNEKSNSDNKINSEQNEKKKEIQSDTIKIFEFAKNKIQKIIISNIDSRQVYALIKNKNHIETIDLSTSLAKDWLRQDYFLKTKKIHSDESYKNALGLLKALAIFDKTLHQPIFNRVASSNDAIFYDLVSPDWKVVKITESSAAVIDFDENIPVFERKQHQKHQILPDFEYENPLEELMNLLRIQDKDKVLFKVHLISMLIERCPIPIMAIVGEQGSIKTTITKSIKKIVDPSGESVSFLPKKVDELILKINNRYLANFDNISSFNQEISDVLCRAITGEGQSKRQLYTDSDEIIYNYRRKIILNGITPSLEYPDLKERCIVYETFPLKEDERITEEEFHTKFDTLLPKVLGQIFDILSVTLKTYWDVKKELKKLPRMADFTIYGECITRALGYEDNLFITLYKEKLQLNSLDIFEAYPIMHLVESLMKKRNNYEDTVSSFHKELTIIASLENVDINSRQVNFPTIPNKIRQHIEKLKPNFRALGYDIVISPYRKNDGKHPKNRQIIYITNINIQQSLEPHLENSSLLSLSSLPYLANFTPKLDMSKDSKDSRDSLVDSQET